MKSPTSLVRLKTFQMREKQKHLQQLEMMEHEFRRMAAALDIQIKEEERKSGICDTAHFAYSIFAKAARSRRDNLLNSIHNLQARREAALQALERAETDLDKAQALEKREGALPAAEAETDFAPRRAMIG